MYRTRGYRGSLPRQRRIPYADPPSRVAADLRLNPSRPPIRPGEEGPRLAPGPLSLLRRGDAQGVSLTNVVCVLSTQRLLLPTNALSCGSYVTRQ
jgi:hypothetical protein